MDLTQLTAYAEIINAAAVTLTLIALIVTIRQSTRAQKALAVDSPEFQAFLASTAPVSDFGSLSDIFDDEPVSRATSAARGASTQ